MDLVIVIVAEENSRIPLASDTNASTCINKAKWDLLQIIDVIDSLADVSRLKRLTWNRAGGTAKVA